MNLGAAAAAALLTLYTIVSFSGRGLFEYWGADFRAFRAAAEVARVHGYAAVYDLAALEPPQRRLVETYASPAVQENFYVIPTPYLPPFVVPFLATLALEAVPGWLLWTVLNAAVLLLYSRRLGRAFGIDPPLSPFILTVSLPVFLTLAFGQVNVWLAIGFGEFLIGLQRRRDFAGGVWLGLLWFKPQILALLVVGLAFGRRWRVLAGLSVVSAVVLILSLLLAGPQGLMALSALWLGYAGDLPTTYPESMMNWRALILNIEPLLGQSLARWIGLVGMVVTAFFGIRLWRRSGMAGDHQNIAAGSYAASSAIAWHSHVHMALPLVALMGNGSTWERSRARWLLALGIVPAAVFAFVGLTVDAGTAHRLAGTMLLAANLAVLAAAVRARRSDRHPSLADSSGGNDDNLRPAPSKTSKAPA